MVPFNLLTVHRGKRSCSLNLSNIVRIPLNPKCTLAYSVNGRYLFNNYNRFCKLIRKRQTSLLSIQQFRGHYCESDTALDKCRDTYTYSLFNRQFSSCLQLSGVFQLSIAVWCFTVKLSTYLKQTLVQQMATQNLYTLSSVFFYVTSVNSVFVSDKIINNSDNFRIKCLSYSEISAILCVFSFCFYTFY